MQALVTGASGFLGGRLVALLLGRGASVTILARPGSLVVEQAGVRIVRSAGPPPQDLLQTTTHVFHCAGCSTDWAPLRTYQEGNVENVRVLLEAVETGAPRLERFVHVSTTDVFGYPQHAGDETMPRRDVGLPYNATKLAGEELVWAAAKRGVPVTVVRPASIYGPGGKAFVTDIVALLRQRLMLLVEGGRVPGGFVYVDDVCAAMIAAAASPVALMQDYNLSSVEATSWRTYVDALARALDLPLPWLQLPFPAAMALAAVSELPHKAGLPGRPLLTRHAVYLLARDQQYSSAKAERELGWRPTTSLDEGVARSVRPLRR